MRLRFVAPGHQNQTCTVFGRGFPHGRWTAVDGLAPDQIERLAANPTFEVEVERELEAEGGGEGGAEVAAPRSRRPILRLPTPPAEA